MRFRFFAVLPLLVGLGLAEPAFALPPPAAAPAAAPPAAPAISIGDRARAFAAKHNLPVRTVQVNVEGRQVTRVFLPVTEATHDAFVKEFTDGGAVIRQRQADVEHVTMALSPTELIHNWGQAGPMFDTSQGGLYVALDLNPVEKAHFKATVQTAQNTNFVGKNGSANCTRWLVHGCIAPEQPLSHKFGIKRSNAPSNMIKKLIHAGNDQVVIGVAVSMSPAHTQQLRNEVARYDQHIQAYEGQIAALELQGGGRVQAFKAQAAPYQDALVQLDATIALRQGAQPAIAAALKAKKTDIGEALKQLTAQHEAPYHQRVGELEAAVVAGRAKVKQLEVARDAELKGAAATLTAREHEKAELLRVAPGPGKSTRFDRKLVEIDQALRDLKQRTDQGKAQRAASRAQQRTAIAQAKLELRGLAQQGAKKPAVPAGNAAALAQRVTQLDQQIQGVEQAIVQHAAQPGFEHQVDDWRTALAELGQEKQRLVQGGPANFNPQFTHRLTQLDQQLEGLRKSLTANPTHPNVPGWLVQRKGFVEEREALLAKGPASYNPAYEQRIAQLDQGIKQNKETLQVHGDNPAYKGHVPGWRAAVEQLESVRDALTKAGPSRYEAGVDQQLQRIASRVQQARTQLFTFDQQDEQQDAAFQQYSAPLLKQREDLVQLGADKYHPEYDAEVAGLDASVKPVEAQIAMYANQPRYAAHVAQWRVQRAALDEQRNQLRAQDPHDFNPAYLGRIGQLDATIKAVEGQVAQYRMHPAYAAHLQAAEAQLAQNVELKATLTQLGPRAYDPQFEQKLTANAAALTQAKQQLDALTARHAGQVDLAKEELTRHEAMRTEIKRHGATSFNPAYEQRLVQLDQAVVQVKTQLRQYGDQPQYAQHRAGWLAQIEQNDKERAAVLEKGPEHYNPNDPQIQGLRQQIAQQQAAAAPRREQLAIADAAENRGDALAAKFAAIPEPTLMGAPPGGGAVEAIRH